MTEADFIQNSAEAITEVMTATNKMAGLLKEQPGIATMSGLVTSDILKLMVQAGNVVAEHLGTAGKSTVIVQDSTKLVHGCVTKLNDAHRAIHEMVTKP